MGARSGGEEANVDAAPPPEKSLKKNATYSSLWGAFSPYKGLSVTFYYL